MPELTLYWPDRRALGRLRGEVKPGPSPNATVATPVGALDPVALTPRSYRNARYRAAQRVTTNPALPRRERCSAGRPSWPLPPRRRHEEYDRRSD